MAEFTVTFEPTVYTFVSLPGYQMLWNAPAIKQTGVYLWCIEYEGAFLVNYVGKASGKSGFLGRLKTEWQDWIAGRYRVPVDVDQYKRGRRVVLDHDLPGLFERAIQEIVPLTRIALARIAAADCLAVESLLVHALRAESATYDFLYNRDKAHKYRPSRDAKAIVRGLPIIGLTAPVPASLVGE